MSWLFVSVYGYNWHIVACYANNTIYIAFYHMLFINAPHKSLDYESPLFKDAYPKLRAQNRSVQENSSNQYDLAMGFAHTVNDFGSEAMDYIFTLVGGDLRNMAYSLDCKKEKQRQRKINLPTYFLEKYRKNSIF